MDDQQRRYRNGLKVDTLYRAVRDSQAADLVPQLIRQILEDEMWREHTYQKTNETFQFDSFQRFVETHAPDGLSTKIEVLFKLCLEDSTAMEMIDRAIEVDVNSDDPTKVRVKRPAASSARQAGLRRLRHFAENNTAIASLRQEVLAGKISISRALIQAGLKKPRISMPKDVKGATRALKRNFNSDEIEQIMELMAVPDLEISPPH